MPIPKDISDNITAFYDLPDSFYKALINSLDSGVYLVDQSRLVMYWNRAAERISGYSADEIMGNFCGDGFLEHVDFDGNYLCGSACPLKATIEDGESREIDVLLKHKDGHRIPVRVRSNPVYDRQGVLIGAVESFYDVTPDLEARLRMQQLAQEANTDLLTGITNRRMAEQMIESALEKWRRYRSSFGVLFIDVDEFKKINDVLGHNVGDVALQTIARTLRALFRTDDIVARWGGDEFVIILIDVNQAILEKVIKKIEISISTTEIPSHDNWGKLSVSVGGAVVQNEDTLASIIERADKKMYQSKKQKKQK